MARIQKSKLQPITEGPGAKVILRIIDEIAKGKEVKKPVIPLFGGSYRTYPVRIERVEVFRRYGELLVNLTGVLDYRDIPQGKGLSGRRAIIKHYNPQTRRSPLPVLFVDETEIPPGTRVVTLEENVEHRHEWTEYARSLRKWGVMGVVLRSHGGHGICYDVRHADGSEGTYDPTELKVIVD